MVCSGNLCRSPIAEQLLRARTIGYPIRISSAGTIAHNGKSMPDEAAEVSRRYGGDPSGHLSRLLTEALLIDTDLALTATRAHRSAVVQILPRMSRRTFTINEFARLVGALSDTERDSLTESASVVEAARSLRGFVAPPENPEDDDLEDPYLRSIHVYERVAESLHLSIDGIADVLTKCSTSPLHGRK